MEQVTEWLAAPDLAAARWLFTRALAAIYAIAFCNALLQFRPLLGADGLLPVPRHLRHVSFREQPSLFHLRYSDGLAMAVAGSGLVLALLLVAGLPQRLSSAAVLLAWLLVYALYLSIVNVGQIWYAFGWESILLEAGFFAAFLGADDVAPSRPAMLLLAWLLFRVEFGAGLIKLRGDSCWRDLTCLDYHHETQPLPGPFSWYAHHLPRWWHLVEVVGNHITQLVMPFGLFAPQPIASIAAAAVILTQGWLVLTGNFAWLNALTITLATAALDDGLLRWLPAPSEPAPGDAWLTAVVLVVFAWVLVLSRHPVRNMLSRTQKMNASFNPFHLVGTYGAFGSITRRRDELVIEGTRDRVPGPDSTWHAYELKGKPGDPRRRPRQVAPYHLRLDWLMWFAALSHATAHGWLLELVRRLLEGDRLVRRLLRHDPFPDRPPGAVRIVRYRYRYTTREERRETGCWWHRRRIGEDLPPVTRSPQGHLVEVGRRDRQPWS